MKKCILCASLLVGISFNCQAATEQQAVDLAYSYSKLIACTLPSSKAEYTVLEIEAGDPEYDNGDGSVHLVHWLGDTGCHKGSGTVRSNFTVITDTIGSGPVLVTNNMVDLGFGVDVLKEFSFKDGLVTIKGTVPGETKWDQKDVEYKLKYNWGEFSLAN